MQRLLIVCVGLASALGCQPRPRRELDGGDASEVPDVSSADDVAAAPDATIDDRPSAPDVVLDEEGGITGGPQTPPQGRAALLPWLQEGAYRAWNCHRSAHIAPAPSAHAFTRVCLNTSWSNTLPSQVFPVGAAAVKELYDATLMNRVGYSVMLKVGPGNTPSDWYWFQQVPAGTMNPALPEPIEPDGTVADRIGTGGNALRLCASCHSTAGEGVGDAAVRGHHFGFTLDVTDY